MNWLYMPIKHGFLNDLFTMEYLNETYTRQINVSKTDLFCEEKFEGTFQQMPHHFEIVFTTAMMEHILYAFCRTSTSV